MKSTLTKNQSKQFRKELSNGDVIIATVRHDDRCGNGHNTFAITGELYDRGYMQGEVHVTNTKGVKRYLGSCGMLHEEIAKHFPELRPILKWHGCATDGPLHYIANSVYWAKQGNLEHFRSCAVWPEATEEQMKSEDLKEQLEARLDTLMAEFKQAVESLGFTY